MLGRVFNLSCGGKRRLNVMVSVGFFEWLLLHGLGYLFSVLKFARFKTKKTP